MKKKDKIILVKYDRNYADEFDTAGFALYTENAWKQHLKLTRDLFIYKANMKVTKEQDPYGYKKHLNLEIYFGTNEAQIYESYSCYAKSFKVCKLTAKELDILKKTFKLKVCKSAREDASSSGATYGHFIQAWSDIFYEVGLLK